MRKNYSVYLLIFGLLISVNTEAQLVSTFDDLSLNAESYWNGSDGSGSFISGQAMFKNSYNADWGSWSGFAYSNVTDNKTVGYINQYSAIPGKGFSESSNYGVCYAGSSDSIIFEEAKDLFGIYVTNSTYAALSMKEGDAFSKKFGGETGTDPDWFLLTIEAFNENREAVGVVEFYLADFRFENSADDYIVENWQMVDLSNLKGASFITFRLTSSDNGDWGMNTPGYFCLDDLIIKDFTNITFTVNDGINNLEGVELEFAGSILTTDMNGLATFSSVSPTTEMVVSVSKEGYVPQQQILNGFYDQQLAITLLPTHISDENAISINIYPNPVIDFAVINASSEMQSIEIYNLSGGLVMKKILSGSKTATLQVDKFSTGIYIIEVRTKQGITHKQLIKK